MTVAKKQETPAVETPEIVAPAPNVIVALCRVMADLPGIPKDMESPQGYKYRGIEQITIEAQPLFAKHGVVLAPRRIDWRDTVNITVNNKPWTDEKLIVHYRCYGPGGPHDYIDIDSPGIGRDNADKGSNKAMSQAYKYAMLQALCIADAKDDADSHDVPEADEPAEPVVEMVTKAQLDEIVTLGKRLSAAGVDLGKWPTVLGVKLLANKRPVATLDQADTLITVLQARAAELPPDKTATKCVHCESDATADTALAFNDAGDVILCTSCPAEAREAWAEATTGGEA